MVSSEQKYIERKAVVAVDRCKKTEPKNDRDDDDKNVYLGIHS